MKFQNRRQQQKLFPCPSCCPPWMLYWIIGIHSSVEIITALVFVASPILEGSDFGDMLRTLLQATLVVFLLNGALTILLLLGNFFRNPFLMLPWLYLQPVKHLCVVSTGILAEVKLSQAASLASSLTQNLEATRKAEEEERQNAGLIVLFAFGVDLFVGALTMAIAAFRYTDIRLEALALARGIPVEDGREEDEIDSHRFPIL